jgi:sulfate permease, SulP family
MTWWPREYRPEWLRNDLVAGLSTAAVVIPQSMAYAAIAGLPVEVGLYSASVPMAAYALAGTSRALSVSVSSSIAAVTAVAVASTPDPRAAAATLALFSGLFLIAAWLLRLGFVADLISAPVLAGFKVGIGLSIAVGQLDDLLGVRIDSDRFLGQLWQALMSLPSVSLSTVLVSLACIAILLAGRRWLWRVPASLIVVVLAIAVTWIGGLERYGVALIDAVPPGLPLPALPSFTGAGSLIAPAVGVALITFVESIAAARAFQASSDRPVVADRELGALGLANVVASLLRGMPAGGGMSQTAVNDGAGAKSPLAAIATAATVIITLLFLAPLFDHLPQAALGALVFVAAIGLVDVRTVRTIFLVQRRDGILCLLAAAGVVALGALDGILIAVLISSLTLLYESSRRPVEVLDAVPEDTVGRSIPAGLLMLRPRSDIHFANVQHFRREVHAAIDAAPVRPVVVLFDGSRLAIFEYTAHQSVRELVDELRAEGIDVWTVLPPGAATEAIERFDAAFGTEGTRLFPDAAAALTAFENR